MPERRFEQPEYASPEALLTVDNLASIIRSRRGGESADQDCIENLNIEGQNATICQRLGAGGTKEVYDVITESDGQHYALGICGIQDAPEQMLKKWKTVLQEPQNTRYLREKGFFVNELCEIKPTEINSTPFPGIIMKRFQDHAFRIFDSKNANKETNPLVDKETKLNDGAMLEMMSPIIDEVARLIKQGIRLGGDNFNLSESNGALHLYLSDLGSMKTVEIPEKDYPKYAQYYAVFVIDAFVGSVGNDTYQQNSYIHEMGNLDHSLQPKLEQKILKRLHHVEEYS